MASARPAMAVAKHDHADARYEVEVRLTGGIEQARPFATHEDDRRPFIGLQDVRGFERLDSFGVDLCHGLSSWFFVIRSALTRASAWSTRPVWRRCRWPARQCDRAAGHRQSRRHGRRCRARFLQARNFATIPAVAVPDAHQAFDAGGVEHRNRVAVTVQHARGRARDDESPRVEAGGKAAGEAIRIDIEQPSIL